MTKKQKCDLLCPCDLGKPYVICCAPYHLEHKNADDVETLMRSRYSAYALNKIDYLVSTWHPQTVPCDLDDGFDGLKWIALKIHSSHMDEEAGEGRVIFTARFRSQCGRAQKMQETSRFIKYGQRWFYLEGIVQ